MSGPASDARHRPGLRGVLFGRDREQAILRDCLHHAFNGAGGLVLIGGEAGIGKTSLVQALANEADAQGAIVRVSACYDLTVTPPYGPWLDLFSDLGAPNDRLPLPSAAQHHDAQRVHTRDSLFSDGYEVLVDAATREPHVLVLEDLHWTDAASLEFLRFVARQLGDVPLLLIATYRDTELDRRHPLQSMLPILVREAGATRVNLRPLDEDAITELVHDQYALSPADELRVVKYVQGRAEGNPFFIGEILRTLEEKGFISLTSDGWTAADLTQVPVPPLVQQVIEGRLAHLDERSRELLGVASVVGQDVQLDIWRDASGATDEELSIAISRAGELHILEETNGTPALRFTHALVREALYHELGLPQRRSLHLAVGEALTRRPSPDPDAVAYHFHQARHEQALEWLMFAGERAQQFYAWRTAAERFESVLPFLESHPAYAGARGWLLYRTGLLLIYADPNRGIGHLREAERVAQAIGDRQLAAYASADRGLLRCLIGDVRRGLSEMMAGVDALDELPSITIKANHHLIGPSKDLLSVDHIQRGSFELVGTSNELNIRKGALVFWLAWSGRYADTVSVGEPYVDQAGGDADGMEDSLGDALAGLGHAYAALGRPDDALAAFSHARATYERIDHHFKVGNTAIYELSEAFLPYRADRVMERQWLADQAEAG